ncbi:hypothetical protein FB45DRAFT_872661 [Roridomyces roridus]|uniref:Uncharacterized protein n=1 Tax=Roridomyces roridus TaxID=1738132 RepID=A0AAD7FDC4_9AGAR|nr:hypothetical protein FB45DRAFT_872661 [Roridomyces roridus]
MVSSVLRTLPVAPAAAALKLDLPSEAERADILHHIQTHLSSVPAMWMCPNSASDAQLLARKMLGGISAQKTFGGTSQARVPDRTRAHRRYQPAYASACTSGQTLMSLGFGIWILESAAWTPGSRFRNMWIQIFRSTLKLQGWVETAQNQCRTGGIVSAMHSSGLTARSPWTQIPLILQCQRPEKWAVFMKLGQAAGTIPFQGEMSANWR